MAPTWCAGPVDAAYKAVDALVGVEVNLDDYSVNSVTDGIEALAVTRCVLRPVGSLAAQGVIVNAQVRKNRPFPEIMPLSVTRCVLRPVGVLAAEGVIVNAQVHKNHNPYPCRPSKAGPWMHNTYTHTYDRSHCLELSVTLMFMLLLSSLLLPLLAMFLLLLAMGAMESGSLATRV